MNTRSCDEHFDDPGGGIRAIIFSIVNEVGSSEMDTEAFLQAVAND